MSDGVARCKRLRMMLEMLLSSDEEDDPPSPSRRDEEGRYRRRGGWHPAPRSRILYRVYVDGLGLGKWRHDWRGSKLWNMLQDSFTAFFPSFQNASR